MKNGYPCHGLSSSDSELLAKSCCCWAPIFPPHPTAILCSFLQDFSQGIEGSKSDHKNGQCNLRWKREKVRLWGSWLVVFRWRGSWGRWGGLWLKDIHLGFKQANKKDGRLWLEDVCCTVLTGNLLIVLLGHDFWWHLNELQHFELASPELYDPLIQQKI